MNFFANKLKESAGHDLPQNPIELYQVLPHKEGYAYLRGVQEEVLNNWNARRDEKDIVCKMDTGSGKTLVGLMMLYSKIAEGIGPCLYMCPDNQLINQVVQQAGNYGIPVCQFESSSSQLPLEFLNNKSILVCTAHKVFHSYSAFRLKNIDLGAIVIDDAHKCVDIIRDQTTIQIDRTEDWSDHFIKLFESDLEFQSPANYIRLIDGDPYYQMRVPYWAWQEKHGAILKMLKEHAEEDFLKWKWDLVANNLLEYDCFISGSHIELSPIHAPHHEISSFDNAKHRFILSATFEDEQDLIKDMGISYECLINPIKPKDRKEIGQRLILAPSRIDSTLDDEQLRALVASYKSNKHNIVIITPSGNRAALWASVGARIVATSDVKSSVANLADTKGNFLVLVNRYEGIDLIGDMCRILVIDGLPRHISLRDHYLEQRLDLVDASRKAQIIEQGLGRAARSGADYCAIFLLGDDLTRFMGIERNLSYFTPITRAQIKLGLSLFDKEEVTNSINSIKDVTQLCIDQNSDWRAFHTKAILKADLDTSNPDKIRRLLFAKIEKDAIVRFRRREFVETISVIDQILSDPEITAKQKSWYFQLAAQLSHLGDVARSNDLQIKAASMNGNMFHPAKGYVFAKIKNLQSNQASIIKARLSEYSRTQDVSLLFDNILKNLKYTPDIPSKDFERSLSELGHYLGFKTQKPETELGQGPDVLWCLNNSHYLILEAKSRSVQTAIPQKHIEQLLHSELWFKNTYGSELNYTLVTLQPTSKKMSGVNTHDRMKSLNQDGLESLKAKVVQFKNSITSESLDLLTEEKIHQQIVLLGFSPDMFIQKYMTNLN
ncbi:MAG TPA: DEAD/DEAH box helicase [Bacteroidia bacterium]|nr:DEAD/DEAH box helicase [Bacteroidia bacterium]